ncbi:hypothetical protein Bca101_012632 [Brassica carinata]
MDSIFIRTSHSSRYDCKSDDEKHSDDRETSSKYPFVSALSMSGGDGDNSYSTNSLLQCRHPVRFLRDCVPRVSQVSSSVRKGVSFQCSSARLWSPEAVSVCRSSGGGERALSSLLGVLKCRRLSFPALEASEAWSRLWLLRGIVVYSLPIVTLFRLQDPWSPVRCGRLASRCVLSLWFHCSAVPRSPVQLSNSILMLVLRFSKPRVAGIVVLSVCQLFHPLLGDTSQHLSTSQCHGRSFDSLAVLSAIFHAGWSFLGPEVAAFPCPSFCSSVTARGDRVVFSFPMRSWRRSGILLRVIEPSSVSSVCSVSAISACASAIV